MLQKKKSFKLTASVVSRSSMPRSANFVSFYVLYDINIEVSKAVKLIEPIAPHGNENSSRHE